MVKPPHSRGVNCPVCSAKAGEQCVDWQMFIGAVTRKRCHPERTQRAKRKGVVKAQGKKVSS